MIAMTPQLSKFAPKAFLSINSILKFCPSCQIVLRCGCKTKEIVQFLTAGTGPAPANACPWVSLWNLNSRMLMAKHFPGSQICPWSAHHEAVLLPGLCLSFPWLISIPQPTGSEVRGKHPAMHLSSELWGSGWWEGFLQLLLTLEDWIPPPWWFPGWQSLSC